jgi:hypothetical protein
MTRLSFLCICLLSASQLLSQPANQPAQPKGITPGSYQIRNKAFGELLRPQEARSANGTPIVLYPAQPWKCMTWKLQPAGESTFHLQNHFTSKTFAADAKSQEASVVQVPFAKESAERPAWKFERLGDGAYKITDAQSGKVLTAIKESSGVRIKLAAWTDKDDQKWGLEAIDPKQLTM